MAMSNLKFGRISENLHIDSHPIKFNNSSTVTHLLQYDIFTVKVLYYLPMVLQ
jgi:hypothetical protein